MKISVLISVYNKENPLFLDASLNSIINQTIQPDEIILIEDGPLTKELELVIIKYKSIYKSLKNIHLEKNQGLAKALNEGLKHCKNELIARMDSDDIAKPTRLAKQLEIFLKFPNIDICSSWIEEFQNSTDNILAIKKLPEKHENIIKYAKHRCPINHPAVMYKKNAVLSVGGYDGFPEDYRLWIKMIMKGYKFYNIQESLLFFRFSPDMIKRRGGRKYALNDIKSQIDFYKMGFLSFHDTIYNIVIRVIVRIFPNRIRTYIYKQLLRK